MQLSIFDQYQDRYLAEEEAAAKAAGFKVFFPSHVAVSYTHLRAHETPETSVMLRGG